MAREIRLPKLGQTMEEGTIINSLIKEGDKVRKGDCIFEIETDKATFEMESPAEGFVKKILVEPFHTVSINTPLAVLGDKDEEVTQSYIDSLRANIIPLSRDDPNEAKRSDETSKSAVSEDKPKQDEFHTLGRKITLTKLQRENRRKMVQSKREIPCFYLTVQADVTEIIQMQEKMNKANKKEISIDDFLIRSIALGLKEFGIMTGQLAKDFIQLRDNIGIGLTIPVHNEPVVLVIKDPINKNVIEIAACRQALIASAIAGKLADDQSEGGCITLSNLGQFGIDLFIPIVVPGECSILGAGRITDTYVPHHGEILTRKLINLTISVDHKVANGAEAAQFLEFIKKILENPNNLV